MIMRSIKFAIRKGLKFEPFNEDHERQKSKNAYKEANRLFVDSV
jgi:hypothetical protein